MRDTMRLWQRNGWYYIEFYRGKHKALRTQDPREARELYNALKKKYLRGKLHNLETLRDDIDYSKIGVDAVNNCATG